MYDDHTRSPKSMPHAPATVDNSNGAWSQSNIQLNTHTHAEFHRLTSAGSISTLSISNDDSTPHISHDWEWRRDCLKRHCKHIGWRLLCSGRELSFFSIFSLFKKKNLMREHKRAHRPCCYAYFLLCTIRINGKKYVQKIREKRIQNRR